MHPRDKEALRIRTEYYLSLIQGTGGGSADLSDDPPADVSTTAASAGVGTEASRADHKHDIVTAAPSQGIGGGNAEGSAAGVARADHDHAIRESSGPTDLTVGSITDGQYVRRSGSALVGIDPPSGGLELTDAAPEDVDTAAAAVGVSSDAARADHKHDVATAAPSTGIGGGNAEGASTAVARADHDHALRETSGPTDLTIDDIADGQYLVRSGTSITGTDPPDGGASVTDDPPANVTRSAAVVGVSVEAARADHKHDVSTAAPVSIGTSNSEGNASSLARSNHVHDHGQLANELHHALVATARHGFQPRSRRDAGNNPHAGQDSTAGYEVGSYWVRTDTGRVWMCTDNTAGAAVWVELRGASVASIAPADVTPAAASAGTSNEAARADHKHDVATAAAVSLSAATSNAEGSANSLARSDHTHDIATAAPASGSVVIDGSPSEGSSSSLSRADHRHGLSAAAPVAVGAANSEGASASVARADHVHDHGNQTNPAHHAPTSSSGPGFQPQSNRTATTNPGAGDDINDGYVPGSYWINLTANRAFTCVDNAAGSAIWVEQRGASVASVAPANVTRAAASAGTSIEAARADHKHDIATAAPGASSVVLDGSPAEGSSSSLARADHVHPLAAAAPSTIGTSNSEGASSSVARADHVHNHGNQTTESHHALTSSARHGFQPRSNRGAIADPSQVDDAADGYDYGSYWVNIVNGRVWQCVDPTTGAAVWRRISDPVVQHQAFSAGGVTLNLDLYDDLIINTNATAGFILGFTGGYDGMRGEVWLRHSTTGTLDIVIGHSTRTEVLNGPVITGPAFRAPSHDSASLIRLRYRLLTIAAVSYFAIEMVGGDEGSRAYDHWAP